MGKNFCWNGLSRREMNLRTGTKTAVLVGRDRYFSWPASGNPG
ncbi:MAG: hypothetical protein ACLQJ7_14175 [Syntrophobacteraceae bacterium]